MSERNWSEWCASDVPRGDGRIAVERHIHFAHTPEEVCAAIVSAADGMVDARVDAQEFYESSVIVVSGYVTPDEEQQRAIAARAARDEERDRAEYGRLTAKYAGESA